MPKTSEVVEVKIGDVFVSSWGYDQTNVCYYQVTDLTPSGKSARLRRIESMTVEEDPTFEMRVPKLDHFVGSEFTKRIGRNTAFSDPYFRMASFEYAFPWSGEAKYASGPYGGH